MKRRNDQLTNEVSTVAQSGLSDCLAAGQIFRAIPYDIVDEALKRCNRTNRRLGPFPDHIVVYFVILMCLFMDLSYEHTLIMLQQSLQWIANGTAQVMDVTDEAITKARQRLGFLPLENLFKLVAKPLSSSSMAEAFVFGHLLVVIDGTIFDVQDTPENCVGFGRPNSKLGEGAYPQVRCVALIEQATRAVLDVAFGPVATTSEYSLAEPIIDGLKPGMLCLADRLYPSYNMCTRVLNSGAQFVWRIKKDVKFKTLECFADGSYLAKYFSLSKKGHRNVNEFIIVRVIEYKLDDTSDAEEYRLITSILDPEQASAEQIARLYPKRWTHETFNSEIKTTLRKRIVLRSKKPNQVIQELYALFTVHYIVRSLMAEAASLAGIPPDSLSFKHSVFILKKHLTSLGDFSP